MSHVTVTREPKKWQNPKMKGIFKNKNPKSNKFSPYALIEPQFQKRSHTNYRQKFIVVSHKMSLIPKKYPQTPIAVLPTFYQVCSEVLEMSSMRAFLSHTLQL